MKTQLFFLTGRARLRRAVTFQTIELRLDGVSPRRAMRGLILRNVLWSLASVLLAAGCAVGPDYKPPAMSAPEHFAGGAPGGFTTNEPVADWWRGFGDAELARLVERAAASNLDLRIATANLLQARALRLGAKADFLPVAEGQASYNNVKYSEAEVFDAPGAQLQPGTLHRRFRRHLGIGHFWPRAARLSRQHRFV